MPYQGKLLGKSVPHYGYEEDQVWRAAKDSHEKVVLVHLHKGMGMHVRAAWEDRTTTEPAHCGFIITRAKIRVQDVTQKLWIGGWSATWANPDDKGRIYVLFGRYQSLLIPATRIKQGEML